MKRNFTDENFEEFLRQNAEQLRMYPSQSVWKGIHKNLNKRRRWVGFGLSTLFISLSLMTYVAIESSKTSKSPIGRTSKLTTTKSSSPQSVAEVQKNFVAATSNSTSITSRNILNERTLAIPAGNFFEVAKAPLNETIEKNMLQPITFFNPTIVDEYSPVSEVENMNTTEETTDNDDDKLLSIESVVNLYRKVKKSKIDFQVYFTPTVSYRKLSANKSFLRNANQGTAPSSIAPLYDINNVVTHKPDMGLELGLAAKYPIGKNLKIRGGLQFNINRYDIKAFTWGRELTTIALTNGRGVDSVRQATNYRNQGGYKTDWLQNFYFQISAPVGIELKVKGDEKVQFGIATTVQPTYMIGDRAYLLSTDYKNYAEVPWLVRRWNLNTSLETFVSYSTGKLKWQVGPQVRYQLLSSFVKEYPVKENLFDFGLKVGISLNNQ